MGSKTVVQNPTPPAAPTTAQSVDDYVANLPKMYQAELDYNPKYAEQEFQLAQQYYPEYTKLMQQSEASIYPETAALQENLAKQAREGMGAAVPESMRAAYLDQLRANLGTNIGSPIAADYTSRGLLNLQKEYNDYYRDLGLSITNRLPLRQTATPGFKSAGEGYNFGQTSNNMMQGYGAYSNAYSSMYGVNAGVAQANTNRPWQLAGAGLGAAGAFLGARR